MPWSLLNNAEELQPKKINEDSVGFYQTHVCKFPLNTFISENLNNKDIEIVNDVSSSVECFNKVNGADLIKNKIKIYIGTNINIDLLYQSLIWLFLIFLIPKKEEEKFKFTYLPIPILIIFFYIHLLGEKKYYQSFSKDYKETLGIDNYYLLSFFITLVLIFVLFIDINKTRFKNYINYFPFMFLVVGTYNSINLNFFILIFFFFGIISLFNSEINLKYLMIYIIFSYFWIYNLDIKESNFDVDKLKGFINTSQNTVSLAFWIIVFYFVINGLIYLINKSINTIDIEKLTYNFLLSGSLLVGIGFLSAINPLINFYSYYFLGLNKFGMKTLDAISGNTWRGISPSAELIGEYFAFVILFTLIIKNYYKIPFKRTEIVLIIINLLGLFRSNNFAAASSLLFFIFIYYLNLYVKDKRTRNIILFFIIILIVLSYFLFINDYSFQYMSEALIYNGVLNSQIDYEFPVDQFGMTAIERSNYGEIISVPKEDLNLSSSLYAFINNYVNSGNIKNIPSIQSTISAVSLPINRSEKWGIFLSKYNPNLTEFLFGYGPQQISEYYLGHSTKNNTGLVLPHSSFLDCLIFFGLFGLIVIIGLIQHLFSNSKSNIPYRYLLFFMLINILKSDSLLYINSVVLFIFILSFYKFEQSILKSSELKNYE